MKTLNKETIDTMKLKFWVEKKMGNKEIEEALIKDGGSKEMALIKLYCKTYWSEYDKYRRNDN